MTRPDLLSAVLTVPTLLGVLSCSSSPPPPLPAFALEPRPAHLRSPPGDREARRGATTNVYIAPEIREACGVHTAEAYFAFDSSQVSEREGGILEKLAQCFTRGGMFGHTMVLVGHADPRGDEEYNMLLGGRRAEAVREALIQRGLQAQRIRTSSRGEFEANGTDEAGWQLDRRVDVLRGE